MLSRKQLKSSLKYSRFPDAHRKDLWRWLMRLPQNENNLSVLDQNDEVLVFVDPRFQLKLNKVLSCLGNWAPLFRQVDYFPKLCFPFVCSLKSVLLSVETIMFVILNFCKKWWEYYPNPPIEAMEQLDQMLKLKDPKLHAHFSKYSISPVYYAFPVLETMFSESLVKESWLELWDKILVCANPDILLECMVSLLLFFRAPLMLLKTKEHVELFLCTPRRVSLKIQHKSHSLTYFNEYPLFQEYPVFIVDYQAKLFNEIKNEEKMYMQRRKTTHDIDSISKKLQDDQKHWDESEKVCNDLLEEWWQSIIQKENEYLEFLQLRTILEKKQTKIAAEQVTEARQSFLKEKQESILIRGEKIKKALEQKLKNIQERKKNNLNLEQLNKIQEDLDLKTKQLIESRKQVQKLEQQRLQMLF